MVFPRLQVSPSFSCVFQANQQTDAGILGLIVGYNVEALFQGALALGEKHTLCFVKIDQVDPNVLQPTSESKKRADPYSIAFAESSNQRALFRNGRHRYWTFVHWISGCCGM